jgi:hypothetical protein
MNALGNLQSGRLQQTGVLWPSQQTARLCSRELGHCRSFIGRRAIVRAAADQEQVSVAGCGECGSAMVEQRAEEK